VPEHRLNPLTPLGRDLPVSVTIGAAVITENTGTALASLAARAGREADLAAAARVPGIPLPGPGHAAAGPTYAAFWLGPQQWMIEAPFASHEDIVAQLKPLFGDAASITEQTDAWVRFDVAGPDLPAMFERLCAFDLRARGPGAASRTVIDHLGCYLVLRDHDALSVLGPRSAAGSLFHALNVAAKSAY